jgi:hypothetical protein
MTRKQVEHLHNDLIGVWCECGEGPFTRSMWDDHRMALLGELPITLEETQLLDELDDVRTKPDRARLIEARLTSLATGMVP